MKNSQKGFVMPLLIVIAVLVIGGGVYFYTKSSQSSSVNAPSISQNNIDTKVYISTTTLMQGVAMQPTYKAGVTLKVSRDVSIINRGDVIAFTHPSNLSGEFIKRVVGLPGETISIVGGNVYVNNSKIIISQIPSVKGPDLNPMKLDNNQYFVLGDNTEQSADSRALGPIPKASITGIITGTLNSVSNNSNLPATTINQASNAGVKVFACDNSVPSQGQTNVNGKIAAFKALNFELTAYLNSHSSYPTSLSNFDNYGTKQDFSGVGYLYAFYPKVNPTHYHIGMKIENGSSCNSVVASNFKTKANFNSRTVGYVNGFDGTDSSILDFHDSQN